MAKVTALMISASIGWAWVGLNDLAVTGTWQWVDGTDCSYAPSNNCGLDTHWNTGEPTGGTEHCTYVHSSGVYNDISCTGTPSAIICNDETGVLKSFGIKTSTISHAGAPFPLTVTVIHASNVYKCDMNAANANTEYSCDALTSLTNSSECGASTDVHLSDIKFILELFDWNAISVQYIFINVNDGTNIVTTTRSTFCIYQDVTLGGMWESPITNTICKSNQDQYNDLCLDNEVWTSSGSCWPPRFSIDFKNSYALDEDWCTDGKKYYVDIPERQCTFYHSNEITPTSPEAITSPDSIKITSALEISFEIKVIEECNPVSPNIYCDIFNIGTLQNNTRQVPNLYVNASSQMLIVAFSDQESWNTMFEIPITYLPLDNYWHSFYFRFSDVSQKLIIDGDILWEQYNNDTLETLYKTLILPINILNGRNEPLNATIRNLCVVEGESIWRTVLKINKNFSFDDGYNSGSFYMQAPATFSSLFTEEDYVSSMTNDIDIYLNNNFKSLLIDEWKNDNIYVEKVKLSFSRNGTEEKYAIFDITTGARWNDWLDLLYIYDSSWTDLYYGTSGTNYHYINSTTPWDERYFIIWQQSCCCTNDMMWFGLSEFNGCNTEWGEGNNIPGIFYTDSSTIQNIYTNGIEGDTFIISILTDNRGWQTDRTIISRIVGTYNGCVLEITETVAQGIHIDMSAYYQTDAWGIYVQTTGIYEYDEYLVTFPDEVTSPWIARYYPDDGNIYWNGERGSTATVWTSCDYYTDIYIYWGCWNDWYSRRLNYGPKSYGYDIYSCDAACPQYKYFALQAGSWCCCGNDWDYAISLGPSNKCPPSRVGAGMSNDIFSRADTSPDFSIYPTTTYTLIHDDTSGYCRGTNWNLIGPINVGYVTIEECEYECTANTLCTAYDYSRPLGDQYDCFLYFHEYINITTVYGPATTNFGCWKKDVYSCSNGGTEQLILELKDSDDGLFSSALRSTGVENPSLVESNAYSIVGYLDPSNYLDSNGKYEFYLKFKSRDYRLKNVLTRGYDADQLCLDTYNTHLATIRNALEDSKVRTLCAEATVDSWCWMGFYRDDGTTSNWYWVEDGTPETYTNWMPGQPDDNPEKCVVLKQDTGEWGDWWCSASHPVICNAPNIEHGTNEIRWKQSSWLTNGWSSYPAPGYETLLKSPIETTSGVHSVFYGLGYSDHANCYLDGTSLSNNWFNCVGPNVYWNGAFPGYNNEITEYEALYACLINTEASDKYFIGPNKVTQTEAEAYCQSYQTHLASIHSFNDFYEIIKLCNTIEGHCWSGMWQALVGEPWVNFDGTSVDYGFDNNGYATTSTYPWDTGQPNLGWEQTKLCIYDESRGYHFHDCHDSWLLYPICNAVEFECDKYLTVDMYSPSFDTIINNGIRSIIKTDKSAIEYVLIDVISVGNNSDQLCLDTYGTNLATIRNDYEDAAAHAACAAATVDDYCWIGFYRDDKSLDEWYWLDAGSYVLPAEYTNWQVGNQSGQCVVNSKSIGQWSGLYCNDSHAVLCDKPNVLEDNYIVQSSNGLYRGHNVVVFNELTGRMIDSVTFDTYNGAPSEDATMATYLNNIQQNRIVAITIDDTGEYANTSHLILQNWGCTEVQPSFRQPFVFIGSASTDIPYWQSCTTGSDGSYLNSTFNIPITWEITLYSPSWSQLVSDGNSTHIRINDGYNLLSGCRGHNIVVFHEITGEFIDTVRFDTHLGGYDNLMVTYLNNIEPNRIVAITTCDQADNCANSHSILQSWGCTCYKPNYREPFVFIGTASTTNMPTWQYCANGVSTGFILATVDIQICSLSFAPTTSPTMVPSHSPTQPPSNTPTQPPTKSPSPAPSLAPTAPTHHPTLAPSFTPTQPPSITPSATPSQPPTTIPTSPPSKIPSLAPSNAPSLSPTNVPTNVPSNIPSNTPTQPPSIVPTNAPSLVPSLAPSIVPSIVPSNSPTQPPSLTPSINPSIVPSLAPSNNPSLVPSLSPTLVPSLVPSLSPTLSPSLTPTSPPTSAPGIHPTWTPTLSPSLIPTTPPSNAPSIVPSNVPSIQPSIAPSIAPSILPSLAPSNNPSITPSNAPSIVPSLYPSNSPSIIPSNAPTLQPTIAPSISPSIIPSLAPSIAPTQPPSNIPSNNPSLAPSISPSLVPTLVPSNAPTLAPTTAPTMCLEATIWIRMKFTFSRLFRDRNVILYGGESIISRNCLYMLKLKYNGNLVFYSTKQRRILSDVLDDLSNDDDKYDVIWQTNSSLINDYDEIQSENIRLEFAMNNLTIFDDYEPEIQSIPMYALWTSDEYTNDVNVLNTDNQYEITFTVTDDGCIILNNGYNKLWEICRFNMISTEMPLTTNIYETTTETTSHDDSSQDSILTKANENSELWWLLVLAILVIAVVIVMYLRRKKYKYNYVDNDNPDRVLSEIAMQSTRGSSSKNTNDDQEGNGKTYDDDDDSDSESEQNAIEEWVHTTADHTKIYNQEGDQALKNNKITTNILEQIETS